MQRHLNFNPDIIAQHTTKYAPCFSVPFVERSFQASQEQASDIERASTISSVGSTDPSELDALLKKLNISNVGPELTKRGIKSHADLGKLIAEAIAAPAGAA